jgi:hypothetical protein
MRFPRPDTLPDRPGAGERDETSLDFRMADEITLESDVPVVGAGRAGMLAAVAAERNGAALLCERMHRTHMAAAAESR